MCGIAGVIGRQAQGSKAALSLRVLDLLRHRGPDDHGWVLSSEADLRSGHGLPPDCPADALLLHRRLSILDLSPGGWQPMTSADRRFAIVFNGEIYNFIELRAELAGLGHVFTSHSDTEVLLHALVEWGPRALPRLTGMFGFALLQRQERKLILARDFLGIKPLYYAHGPDGLVFASEIKALLALADLPRRVNPQRLHDYLTGGLTDHGGETMFMGVHQVPAAHYLEVPLDRPRDVRAVRYWSAKHHERLDISYEDATARVRQLFLDNVRLHLRSDVPVGAALSGGIDSSAIVGAMRRLEPKLDLHAFSYVAGDAALSEEKWIDLAAHQAGAVLHKTRCGAGDLVDDIEDLIYQQDEPFGSTSIFAQHRVFRLAREHGITVMLDGQGADEMLGGYRFYLAARLASLIRRGNWLEAMRFACRVQKLPGIGLHSLLLQTAGNIVPARFKLLAKQALQESMMPPWLSGRWFEERGVRPGVDNGEQTGCDVFKTLLHRTLVESSLPMLLRYEDRNSMAHSIESRVPFLTPALVEFLLRLPEDYLIGADGTSKRIFRDAMRGIAPDAILQRKDKIGFATPEKQWFTALQGWVGRTLSSDAAREIPAFNHRLLCREWDHLLNGKQSFDWRAWRWINLIRWAERFDVSFA